MADIVVGSEASIPTPAAGYATLFINTDKNNILYVKYSDGTFQPYTGGTGDCACDMAQSWTEAASCALKKGTITAAEYQAIMSQGYAVITNTVTDPDTGDVQTTVTAGSRDIPIATFAVGSPTAAVAPLGTSQIVTTFTPSNASNQTVTYVSSDDTKATVSATGLITGVAGGSAVISVIPNGNPALVKIVTVTVS